MQIAGPLLTVTDKSHFIDYITYDLCYIFHDHKILQELQPIKSIACDFLNLIASSTIHNMFRMIP